MSKNNFIEPHQIGCREDRVTTFSPLHPINAAAATIFKDIAPLALDTLFNISTRNDQYIPHIVINTSPDDEILDIADGNEAINLERLREMVNHNEEIYLTKSDKLSDEANIESWFDPFDLRGVLAIIAVIGCSGTMLAINPVKEDKEPCNKYVRIRQHPYGITIPHRKTGGP
jgi:hypothetical protein